MINVEVAGLRFGHYFEIASLPSTDPLGLGHILVFAIVAHEASKLNYSSVVLENELTQVVWSC